MYSKKIKFAILVVFICLNKQIVGIQKRQNNFFEGLPSYNELSRIMIVSPGDMPFFEFAKTLNNHVNFNLLGGDKLQSICRLIKLICTKFTREEANP